MDSGLDLRLDSGLDSGLDLRLDRYLFVFVLFVFACRCPCCGHDNHPSIIKKIKKNIWSVVSEKPVRRREVDLCGRLADHGRPENGLAHSVFSTHTRQHVHRRVVREHGVLEREVRRILLE